MSGSHSHHHLHRPHLHHRNSRQQEQQPSPHHHGSGAAAAANSPTVSPTTTTNRKQTCSSSNTTNKNNNSSKTDDVRNHQSIQSSRQQHHHSMNMVSPTNSFGSEASSHDDDSARADDNSAHASGSNHTNGGVLRSLSLRIQKGIAGKVAHPRIARHFLDPDVTALMESACNLAKAWCRNNSVDAQLVDRMLKLALEIGAKVSVLDYNKALSESDRHYLDSYMKEVEEVFTFIIDVYERKQRYSFQRIDAGIRAMQRSLMLVLRAQFSSKTADKVHDIFLFFLNRKFWDDIFLHQSTSIYREHYNDLMQTADRAIQHQLFSYQYAGGNSSTNAVEHVADAGDL